VRSCSRRDLLVSCLYVLPKQAKTLVCVPSCCHAHEEKYEEQERAHLNDVFCYGELISGFFIKEKW
jgi:hypothetical protein